MTDNTNKTFFKNNEIIDIIRKFEEEHKIIIFYAVESGSRMWGFESDDSDYDIRVVFAYPSNIYLGIKPYKETIEYMLRDPETDKPILDIVGWEFKFFVRHMIKSNPSVYEWFMSPIRYIDETGKYIKGGKILNKSDSDLLHMLKIKQLTGVYPEYYHPDDSSTGIQEFYDTFMENVDKNSLACHYRGIIFKNY